MAISYDKLRKRMIDCHLNKSQLRTLANISTNAMAKIGKDESVSIEVLERVCGVLKCDIGDVVEIKLKEDSVIL